MALKHNPQGVSNTKEYKHQHINLRSTYCQQTMDFCLEFATIRIIINDIMLSFHTYHFIYIYIYITILILDIVLPRPVY